LFSQFFFLLLSSKLSQVHQDTIFECFILFLCTRTKILTFLEKQIIEMISDHDFIVSTLWCFISRESSLSCCF